MNPITEPSHFMNVRQRELTQIAVALATAASHWSSTKAVVLEQKLRDLNGQAVDLRMAGANMRTFGADMVATHDIFGNACTALKNTDYKEPPTLLQSKKTTFDDVGAEMAACGVVNKVTFDKICPELIDIGLIRLLEHFAEKMRKLGTDVCGAEQMLKLAHFGTIVKGGFVEKAANGGLDLKLRFIDNSFMNLLESFAVLEMIYAYLDQIEIGGEPVLVQIYSL